MLANLLNSVPEHSVVSWSIADKGEVYRSLVAQIYALDKDNLQRENNILKNMIIYNNTYYTNVFSAFKMFPSLRVYSSNDNKLVLNIAKSAVDTVAAKISKNKIKLQILTDGADFGLQQTVKKLDSAVWSIMYANNFHSIAKDIFKDAAICGTGIVHVLRDGNKVKYERVLPFEILVDELDAMYGKPSKLYRYKLVTISKLKKLFPKIKELDNANTISTLGTSSIEPSTLVFEAWDLIEHRHVMCVSNCDLVDEEYTDTDFPFMFFRWSKQTLGFWGVSLVDEIAPIQQEINKLLYFVQQAMHLGSAPKWFIRPNSIPKAYMNNAIGTVIPVSGDMPQYYAPQPIHNQIINQIDLLKNEAFAIAGISQLSAQSQKPAGLNSGVALQTYNDIETERFVLVGQDYEQLYIECFKRTISICKDIYKTDKKFSIISNNAYNIETLNWSDINLDEQLYQIKPFPISALPQEPAARYARLNEMYVAQIITKEQFLELSDLPDIHQYSMQMYSSTTVIKTIHDKMLRTGIYQSPTKYIDLNLAITLSLQMYNQLVVNDSKPEHQELILQFLDECNALKTAIDASQQKITPIDNTFAANQPNP